MNSIEIDSLTKNPKISYFILGQTHFEKNLPITLAFFKSFVNQKKTRTIAIEFPDVYESLVNDFVTNKNDSIVKILNPTKNSYLKNEVQGLLNQIREYNKSRDSLNCIKLLCFDSAPNNISQSLWAMEYNFRGIKDIDKLKLNDFFRLPYKEGKYYKASKIYNELVRDFKNNKPLYDSVLGDRVNEYKKNLESLKIIFDYSQDVNDFDREDYLYNNLKSILDSNDNMLILTGNMHADLKEKDNIYTNLSINSYSSRLKQIYKEKLCSILTQYCNKKCNFLRILPPIKLISEDCSVLLDSNQVYKFYDKSLFKEDDLANLSCDKVLVVNVKKIKKYY